eukprot:1575738-Prorocentrum_lima.AAC.1
MFQPINEHHGGHGHPPYMRDRAQQIAHIKYVQDNFAEEELEQVAKATGSHPALFLALHYAVFAPQEAVAQFERR